MINIFELMMQMQAFIGTIIAAAIAIVASIVASIILTPKRSKSDLGEQPIQTANRGIPIAYLAGTRLIAGNVLWTGILRKRTGDDGKIKNRRSFLVGLCYGQADVLNIWKKDQKWDDNYWENHRKYPRDGAIRGCFYIFRGDGNAGLEDLINAKDNKLEETIDFAQYKDICCVYFHRFNIQESFGVPEYFFEVVRTLDDGKKIMVGSGGNDDTLYSVDLDTGEYTTVYDLDDDIYTIVKDGYGFYYVGKKDLDDLDGGSGEYASLLKISPSGSIVWKIRNPNGNSATGMGQLGLTTIAGTPAVVAVYKNRDDNRYELAAFKQSDGTTIWESGAVDRIAHSNGNDGHRNPAITTDNYIYITDMGGAWSEDDNRGAVMMFDKTDGSFYRSIRFRDFSDNANLIGSRCMDEKDDLIIVGLSNKADAYCYNGEHATPISLGGDYNLIALNKSDLSIEWTKAVNNGTEFEIYFVKVLSNGNIALGFGSPGGGMPPE